MKHKFILGLAASLVVTASHATLFQQSPPVASDAKVTGLPDFSKLMQSEGSKVVHINSIQKASSDAQNPMNELLRRFFQQGQGSEDDEEKKPEEPSKKAPGSPSIGSGFFISREGHILTNAHVVQNAESIRVKTSDRKEYDAKVIGFDTRTDVALLKIDTVSTPVKFANVNQLKEGEWVAAVGSPFGFENTITAGIVSAKQRFMSDSNYLPFIQSDVAINPGNSGGPLFNIKGEVVGMNTQIYTRSGGYMGMSFSIAIDEAIKIAERLAVNGKVDRSRIGVRIVPLNKETGEAMGTKLDKGLLILQVEDNAPGAKAGLKVGDIILEKDGKAFDSVQEITRSISETPSGTPIKFKLYREGGNQIVTVEALDNDTIAKLAEPTEKEELPKDKVAALFGFELEGNSIVKLDADGKAAGLKVGDKVIQIQKTSILSKKDIESWLDKNPNTNKIGMFIQREKNTHFIVLKKD